MYKITGMFGIKFHPQGFITRQNAGFTQYLNTSEGVLRFIDEQKPFKEFKVELNGEDVTKEFLE